MKATGLKRTAFAVETGDPEMLVRINKRLDHDAIRRAFKSAKQVGIETIVFFIIGLPGDTRESMQRTIDFAIEIDPLIANFRMMTPYPGTRVYEIVKERGRLLIEDWEDYIFFEQWARYENGRFGWHAHQPGARRGRTVGRRRRRGGGIPRLAPNRLRVRPLRGRKVLRRRGMGAAGFGGGCSKRSRLEARNRFVSSFSTDNGYRRTNSYRYT